MYRPLYFTGSFGQSQPKYTYMPIIRSAKKQMRQSRKKQKRNYRMRGKLHDTVRNINDLIKEGNKVEATKALSGAYKVIDTAVKKNLIHKRNGARRKSRLAKQIDKLK